MCPTQPLSRLPSGIQNYPLYALRDNVMQGNIFVDKLVSHLVYSYQLIVYSCCFLIFVPYNYFICCCFNVLHTMIVGVVICTYIITEFSGNFKIISFWIKNKKLLQLYIFWEIVDWLLHIHKYPIKRSIFYKFVSTEYVYIFQKVILNSLLHKWCMLFLCCCF